MGDCDRGTQAFLISFAFAYFRAHSVIAKLEIFNVQRNELRTAERASKTKQEYGTVAEAFDAGPSLAHHRKNLVGGSWRFAGRGASCGASNAAQRGFDYLSVCRRFVPGQLVSVMNGRKPPTDRRHLSTTEANHL
jgi:hypothetical protein